MTKQLHILLTLLLAMIFTSGGVQAAEETIDFTQQGYKAGTAVTTVNGTNFTATFSKGANKTNAPKFYTSGGDAIRMYIKNTLTISSSYTITKIEVTFNKSYYKNFSLDNNQSGTYTNASTSNGTGTWEGSATSVVFINSGTTSGYDAIKSVKVTYETGKTDPNLSFSETSILTTLGNSFTAPILSNPYNVPVTYSSSDATVATVAADGSVSPLKAGTTTITAKSEATDTYDAGEASYILNVTPSLDDAISVAEALKTADGTKVLVKGIVTRTNAYNSKYTDLIYYVADAAADNELEVYKGMGLKGADITNADDIARGDEVFVYGTLTSYKTTKEFAASSIILKQTKAEEKTSITAAGWATYVTARSVDFSKTSDVKAYTVAYSATDDAITLTPVTAVPGNTAVVLEGNQGDYTFTTTTDAAAVSDNNLKFYTKATKVAKAKTVYILANNNGTVGFCPATVGSTVPAYKGYLSISGGTSAKNFFALDGTATGINSIAADKANGRDVRFNLAGQRVDKNYKGVVIVNGKKQLVK